jgi:hypothetical protein
MKAQKTLALVGLVASPLVLALATMAAPQAGLILIGITEIANFAFFIPAVGTVGWTLVMVAAVLGLVGEMLGIDSNLRNMLLF